MITRHPTRVALGLLVATVAFFLLSASGQPNAFWKTGPHWLGAIGWFSFLACLLALVVLMVTFAVQAVRRRGRTQHTVA